MRSRGGLESLALFLKMDLQMRMEEEAKLILRILRLPLKTHQ